MGCGAVCAPTTEGRTVDKKRTAATSRKRGRGFIRVTPGHRKRFEKNLPECSTDE
jgi:hypothetical protein